MFEASSLCRVVIAELKGPFGSLMVFFFSVVALSSLHEKLLSSSVVLKSLILSAGLGSVPTQMPLVGVELLSFLR